MPNVPKKRHGGDRGYDVVVESKRTRRDSRDSYYGRGYDRYTEGRGYDDGQDDWNCLECKTWNYPEEQWCVRCGAPATMRRGRGGESWNERYYHSEAPYNTEEYYDDPPRGGEGNKQEEYRRQDGGSPKGEEGEDVDEFGRVAKRPPPKPREWPSCFDTNGQDFVLDARSAMFYEAESDFFYDPKSKLYYGNKQKAYYRYVAGQKPPFEQVQKVEANTTCVEPVVLNTQPVAKDNNNKGTTKKTISISLKTKTLPKAKAEDKKQMPSVPAPLLKKHEADMEKWSERQVEKKQQAQHKTKQPQVPKQQQEVAKTAKGEPICLLCKRKFPNLEKLQYHERVSKLHKDNLAKKKEAEKQQDYVDRAAQRRIMYGPESSSTSTTVVAPSTTASDVEQTTPVRPEDNLGESNIGNQMLQKLGWKDGASLGRNGNNSSNVVQQDWERIESIAEQGGKKSNQTSAGIGLHRY